MCHHGHCLASFLEKVCSNQYPSHEVGRVNTGDADSNAPLVILHILGPDQRTHHRVNNLLPVVLAEDRVVAHLTHSL